jgi:uncharacterized protein YjiS (DUF1127 family)
VLWDGRGLERRLVFHRRLKENNMSTLHWTDHAVEPKGRRIPGLLALIGEWLRRIESRRELAGLCDRALRDIGLTRVDAMREATKPFWRP